MPQAIDGIEAEATLEIRTVAASELAAIVPELAARLVELVASGFPLGFFAPLSHDEARRYWSSLGAEIRAGSRLLLVALQGGRIVGTGQLAFARWPNARHRAEIHKVFTIGEVRGQGIGLRVMQALHHAALHRGRTLLLLCTRKGGPAETFYQRLGYRVIGTLPGYFRDANGQRGDSVSLYIELPVPLPP